METQLAQFLEAIEVDIKKTHENEAELRTKRAGLEATRDKLAEHHRAMKDIMAGTTSMTSARDVQASVPRSAPVAPAVAAAIPGNIEYIHPVPAMPFAVDHLHHLNSGPTTDHRRPMETKERLPDVLSGDNETIHVQSLDTSPPNELEKPLYHFDTRPSYITHGSLARADRIRQYEVVVYMDSEWTEICCNLCGKNAIPDANTKQLRFINGPNGMISHIRSHFMEADVDKSNATLFGHIVRRVVSDDDAALMRQGKDPAIEIHKTMGAPKKHKSTKRTTEAQQHAANASSASTSSSPPSKKFKPTPAKAKRMSANASQLPLMLKDHMDDGEALFGETMKREL